MALFKNRREGRQLLINALGDQDRELVERILAEDESLATAPNSHQNVPLGKAIEVGSLELVKLLVQHGADPTHANHGGSTLLDGAAFTGQKQIARYLIEEGAVASLLHYAALGDINKLKSAPREDLLNTINAGGWRTMTALHAAAITGAWEAAAYLLEVGADVNALNHHGHTPLAVAVETVSQDQLKLAQLLIDGGADVDAVAGHHHGRILHRAIINGNADFAKLLLDAGADTDVQDHSGRTPLHHASTRNAKFTALVLSYEPDVSIRTRDGEIALALATRLKKNAVVRLLEAC